jgi:hypothetical protein
VPNILLLPGPPTFVAIFPKHLGRAAALTVEVPPTVATKSPAMTALATRFMVLPPSA